MTYEMHLLEPVVLADAELDMVAAGQGRGFGAGGLVGVGVNAEDIDVLRNAFQDFEINVEVNDNIRDIAVANDLNVGALVQALGGVAGIRQRR